MYVLEVDKSLYDVSDPNYTQIHLVRFEIDRTKSKGAKGVKITDIDFYLEGNRHAVAGAGEFYK